MATDMEKSTLDSISDILLNPRWNDTVKVTKVAEAIVTWLEFQADYDRPFVNGDLVIYTDLRNIEHTGIVVDDAGVNVVQVKMHGAGTFKVRKDKLRRTE